MKKPEPLADPLLRAIEHALGDGAHVSRIRLSAQFVEGLLIEEDGRLQRAVDPSHPPPMRAPKADQPSVQIYTFDGYPVVISRISGWVLETWK